ncbi:hypothetical protein ACFQXA_32005 [Nocardiopsis composta]
MNEATAMACELAHTSVVTVTPDLPALRAAQRLIAMWERLQIREKKNVQTLLTRHSKKNEIQPDFARKLLGVSMLQTPIPSLFRSLEEASNTGDPRRITDENLLKPYSKVAGELGVLAPPPEPDLARFSPPPPEPTRPCRPCRRRSRRRACSAGATRAGPRRRRRRTRRRPPRTRAPSSSSSPRSPRCCCSPPWRSGRSCCSASPACTPGTPPTRRPGRPR